jgi:hypothetical protein
VGFQALFTQALQFYAYSDAQPDLGYDNATYTFLFNFWGRIDPTTGTPTAEKFTGGAAVEHREAVCLCAQSVPLTVFGLIVDVATGDKWRITGHAVRRLAAVTQWRLDYAPQFATTASIYGP